MKQVSLNIVSSMHSWNSMGEAHTHTHKCQIREKAGEEKETAGGSRNERAGKASTGSMSMTGSRLKFR